MGALFSFTSWVERRLGNMGLAIAAVVVLFVALTSAASHLGAASSSLAKTTTTVPALDSTTTSALVTSTTGVSATNSPQTTSSSISTRNGLDGYAAVNFSVKPETADGKNYCGLLAASASQQSTGLMNHNDLGGYDAMIFSFDQDTTAAFYMANVPVALSVAWFDASGKFVSSADMEPCKVEASKCQLFKASGPYRTAVETLKGGLGGVGISSGSSLTLGASGPC